MAAKHSTRRSPARSPKAGTRGSVIMFRVPGTQRAIGIALGPSHRFPDVERAQRAVRPLNARGPDGAKLIAPLTRPWSASARKAAAAAITAGVASGKTNAEVVRTILNLSKKGSTRHE